jgi:phospholipase/carboxylesterase
LTGGGPIGPGGDPHAGGRVAQAGAPLGRARLAVVMAHGRGGSPEDMLGLAESLALPDVAYFAPAAAGRSWWPASFLAPIEANEPGLSSGLAFIAGLVKRLEGDGFGPDRIVIVGFSQGACLALEYAARSTHAFLGIVGLSGGLVGTGNADGPPRDELYGFTPKQFAYHARLAGVTVFLGCHERDPHIPLARVQESGAVFKNLGASVHVEIVPGAGHGVVTEEVLAIRGILNR